jgi:large subunit ribosomal protein L3
VGEAMAGLLGKKIRMTQIFDNLGKVIPVTVISAGPCYVTQKKTVETDGYQAIQIGYHEAKEKHISKPQLGHLKKNSIKPMRYIREFEPFRDKEVNVGDELRVDMFSAGEKVIVIGISKGRGFQGTMRRHNFSGAGKTHGQSDRWRAPGSLGQSSYPSRVYPGLRMAGRMGNDRVTLPTCEVVKVDAEQNLLFIKGAVPGAPNSLLEIKQR